MSNPEGIEKNIDRFDCMKLKSFCMVKQNSKLKTNWGQIFANHITGNDLNISRAHIGQ